MLTIGKDHTDQKVKYFHLNYTLIKQIVIM